MGNYFKRELSLFDLPSDIQYQCLFFLTKEEYIDVCRKFKIKYKLKLYYRNCESELMNNNWRKYYSLCKKFDIPLKLDVFFEMNHFLKRTSKQITEEIYENEKEYIDIIKYLNQIEMLYLPIALHKSFLSGHIDTIKYLSQLTTECNMTVDELINGKYNDWTQILDMYEFNKRYKNISLISYTSTYACINNHLDLIKYSHSIGSIFNRVMMEIACKNGHFDLIKYLYSLNVPITNYALECACIYGSLEIIEYLLSTGTLFPTNSIDHAAVYSRLDIVDYLYQKGFRCTTWPIDYLSSTGELETIKYLHSIGAPCTTDAMDKASSRGHLEVVKYLHSIGKTFTRNALDYAFIYGHAHVISYLLLIS